MGLRGQERQNYEPAGPAAAPTSTWPSATPWPSTTSPACGTGSGRWCCRWSSGARPSMGRQPGAGEGRAGRRRGAAAALLRLGARRGPLLPIQVECAFEVNLPDPAGGDRELVLADGRPSATRAGPTCSPATSTTTTGSWPTGWSTGSGPPTSCCWTRSWWPPAGRWSACTRGCGSPARSTTSSDGRRPAGRNGPTAAEGGSAFSTLAAKPPPAGPPPARGQRGRPVAPLRPPRRRPARPGRGRGQPGRRGVPADPDPKRPGRAPGHGGQAGRRGPRDGRPGTVAAPEPGPGALRDLPVRGPVPGHGARRRRQAVLEPGPGPRRPALGAATWGMGRGAAPPRFDSR